MKKVLIPIVGVAVIVLGIVLSGVLEGDKDVPRSNSSPENSFEESRDVPDFAPAPAGGGGAAKSETAPPETTPETPTEDGETLAGKSLAGRVTDLEGNPVSGAIVHLVTEKPNQGWGNLPPPSLLDPKSRLETDEGGTFRYEGLEGDEKYALFVRKDGSVGKRKRRIAADGKAHEFVLAPGDSVTGVVLDPRGGRVEGAVVRAGPALSKLGEGIFVPAGGTRDHDAIHPETTTARDGTYTLTGIPLGEFSISASHDHWGPTESINLMQGQSGLTLELRPSTGVAGRVVDGRGTPIAGATVRAVPMFSFGGTEADLGRTTTDARGNFELQALPPGRVLVRAESEGFTSPPGGRAHLLVEGELLTDLEIVLQPGGVISGIVKNSAGVPVVGASIAFRSGEMHSGRFMGPSRSKKTDETGAFRLEGVRPDEKEASRRVQIDHPEYLAWEGDPIAITPGLEVELGELILSDALTLRGQITDLEGNPVAGATVKLHAGAPGAPADNGFTREVIVMGQAMDAPMQLSSFSGSAASVTADERGRYVHRIDEAGTYHISTEAKGFQSGESAAIEVAVESVTGWDLSLTPAMQIHGVVVDELGVPCEGVTVSVSREGLPNRGGVSAFDGGFMIDGLEAGEYQVTVRGNGWSLAGDPPSAVAGTEGMTVVVLRPGDVTGSLVDASSGRPITQFSLRHRKVQTSRGGQFDLMSGAWSFSTMGGIEYRDPQGRFLLEGLEPGTHTITASAPNMVEASVEVEVASGRTTETTIELQRAGMIVGRVTDTAGNPLPGIHVTAVRLKEDGSEESPQRSGFGGARIAFSADVDSGGETVILGSSMHGGAPSAQTDENGNYRLEGLKEGDHTVKFSSSKYRSGKETPVAVSRGTEIDLGAKKLERGAMISGTMRCAQGRKFMWCSLRFTLQDPPEGSKSTDKHASPDGAGNYAVGGLDAGTYQVTADYMVEPLNPADAHSSMKNIEHDLGTITIGVDEERTLDGVLPIE